MESQTTQIDIDPAELATLLNQRDGAAAVIARLKDTGLASVTERTWDFCGQHFHQSGRYHQQSSRNQRVHKGTALVRIADAHWALAHRHLAKRYMMLTACEDAIRDSGNIPAESTGTYFRLVWYYGIADCVLRRYAHKIWSRASANPVQSRSPEWILQELDQEWMTEYPTPEEANIYVLSSHYCQSLLTQLGSGDGKALERLAHYLLACVPGFRAYMRTRSHSTDYDVVCACEGSSLDFRSELGRYFLCECKDWKGPADVTAVTKFSGILRAAKCKFGIMFSKQGVTGSRRTTDAERALLKSFQQDDVAIAVVSEADLQRVVSGANFIAMLRSKYEQIRLDLFKSETLTKPMESS
jgi:hypothetical protein